MSESSTPVRLLQHHLRMAGARLAAREFDAAAEHIDAALAIDPASLAALTLRERLQKGRSLSGPAADSRGASASAPAEPAASPAPMRFIPAGVNAASWLDFEQRVQDRRFRGLIESAERAMASGDRAAAVAALEEARELRPDSGEASHLSSRIALMPAVHPAVMAQQQETLFHSRAFRAVSLLFVGVTLLMGLDWIRADVPPPQAATAVQEPLPPLATTATAGGASPETPAVVERMMARTVAEEPALSSDATAPVAMPPVDAPRVDAAPVVTAQPLAQIPSRPLERSGEVPDDYVVAPTLRLAREQPVVVAPGGEIPDDYVAPRPQAPVRASASPGTTAPATGRSGLPLGMTPSAGAPVASVVRQPGPVVEPLGSGRSASVTPSSAPTAAPPPAVSPSSAAIAAREVEEQRVRNVVQEYTRAYGQLDVDAVRSIWPSVKARDLERAFANLSAQTISLNCGSIEVTGEKARASCRGQASYVVKVGSRETRVEPRTVNFQFKREGQTWMIENAVAGR